MTSEYVSTNIDLQVRGIVVAAAALPDVSHVMAETKLETIFDDDSSRWFWREVERQFAIVVTKAQRESLPTVGHVVRYLKLRRKLEAHA